MEQVLTVKVRLKPTEQQSKEFENISIAYRPFLYRPNVSRKSTKAERAVKLSFRMMFLESVVRPPELRKEERFRGWLN